MKRAGLNGETTAKRDRKRALPGLEHTSLSEEPAASQAQRRWQQQILLQQVSDPMKPAQHESTQPSPNKHPKPTLTAVLEVLPVPWLQEHPRRLCFHLPVLWPLVAPHAAPPEPSAQAGNRAGCQGEGDMSPGSLGSSFGLGQKAPESYGLI